MIQADLLYQQQVLQGVSRTFALTIPQLPTPLDQIVGNAYLLCRIADTIEDSPGLSPATRQEYSMEFIRLVRGEADAAAFSRVLAGLADNIPASEADLLAHVPQVLRVTHSFAPAQRRILERCVRIMAEGMSRHQQQASLRGLPDLQAMDNYCYHVAGVVGEMLTGLFCDYCPALRQRQDELMPLAVSFGQGLQMTNILKDVWEDRQRGACWLPRALFHQVGYSLDSPRPEDVRYQQVLRQLVGIARYHLDNAIRYTLLIPASEPGMRKFCLWAAGMAVLTLRKISNNPGYRNGQEVKISRRSVYATACLTSLFVRSDAVLRLLFRLAARSLPAAAPPPRAESS